MQTACESPGPTAEDGVDIRNNEEGGEPECKVFAGGGDWKKEQSWEFLKERFKEKRKKTRFRSRNKVRFKKKRNKTRCRSRKKGKIQEKRKKTLCRPRKKERNKK